MPNKKGIIAWGNDDLQITKLPMVIKDIKPRIFKCSRHGKHDAVMFVRTYNEWEKINDNPREEVRKA